MFGFSAFAEAPFASEASNTFNVTVSEASSVSEDLFAFNLLNAEVVQSAESTSVFIPILPIRTAVTAGASSSEIIFSEQFFGRRVEESAVGDDGVAATPVFVGTINQSLRGAPFTEALAFQLGVVLESAEAADEASSVPIYVGKVIELSTGQDQVQTLVNFNSVITEAVFGSDVNIGSQLYSSELLESAETSDNVSRRLLWETINSFEGTDWKTIPTLD